ncbi:MAG: hypothetical protein KKB70_00285, partial [Proteobacteria bacterium]|nr:hypothetical protein [Pseudomonadota bacterium]
HERRMKKAARARAYTRDMVRAITLDALDTLDRASNHAGFRRPGKPVPPGRRLDARRTTGTIPTTRQGFPVERRDFAVIKAMARSGAKAGGPGGDATTRTIMATKARRTSQARRNRGVRGARSGHQQPSEVTNRIKPWT